MLKRGKTINIFFFNLKLKSATGLYSCHDLSRENVFQFFILFKYFIFWKAYFNEK